MNSSRNTSKSCAKTPTSLISSPSLIQRTRATLAQLDAAPLKRLGQNFMISESSLERVAAACALTGKEHVIEIGPGLGYLTEKLAAQSSRLLAIETDRKYASYLKRHFASHNHVEIHYADALNVFWDGWVRGEGAMVVGNFPYQITSPLFEKFLESTPRLNRLVGTIQTEVADRLETKPGQRDRGVLTVWLEMHGSFRRICTFGPGDFYPEPKIKSSLIEYRKFERPLYPAELKAELNRILKKAFQQKRKKISSSLLKGVRPGQAERIRSALGSSPIWDARPEDLTAAEWIQLATAFSSVV